MLCAVYKSRKKAQTYLFVERREDFACVPAALMTVFGRPELVLMTKLSPQKPLGIAPIVRVIDALQTQGYYLQVAPPAENLLVQHKAQTPSGGA
jgi:uncharacterized protein YcgL (UPF0745 family)